MTVSKPKIKIHEDALDDTLDKRRSAGLLRFITCGSVDDGKSTLIGRLLWETRQVFDDQMAALEKDSRRYGTQGEAADFALLVDGLIAEREQGITIDVAYRFFATEHRKFIVADTPGHEQYTRNMVTGASTADVALILVDAGKGLSTQTRRHASLASLMGIGHIALAVNKMDLIGYDEARFESIARAFGAFCRPLNFLSITALPLSALQGDNITERSRHTLWYKGPTLLCYLETVEVAQSPVGAFVFPVQYVTRAAPDFRGFSGTVAQGTAKAGDEIVSVLSGQSSTIARIATMDGDLPEASARQAVTLTLDKEIDVSRGDVLALKTAPLETTDRFTATVVWMGEEEGLVGRVYDLQLLTQRAAVSITRIKHRLNIENLTHEAAQTLRLNDICECALASNKPIVFDAFDRSKPLGAFILIDRFSHATVAAGMIRHSLRRAENVHQQDLAVKREDREKLSGHPAKVVWFTGLSGSGKSATANALEIALHASGCRTFILDGDNVRQGLNKDLGFTDADRVENIRRVAEVAKLMFDAGLVVMAAFISPFRHEREMVREMIGAQNFIEVYVNTPLEVCEQRDAKGLYKKARQGKIPNFSGIGSAYEAPENPDIILDCASLSPSDAAAKILGLIETRRAAKNPSEPEKN